SHPAVDRPGRRRGHRSRSFAGAGGRMIREIVVRPPADLPRAVHAVYREVRRGHRVTAVYNKPEKLSAALSEIGLTDVSVVRHAVTANKAVIAARGPWLETLAHSSGVELLYSASVGGAMPALETVRRHAGQILSFSGVLNATCNFILDQKGVPLDEAVALAQKAGYAEADPRLDLDGTDAMQKLVILSRAAFG